MKLNLKIFLLSFSFLSLSTVSQAQIKKIKSRDRLGDTLSIVNTQEKPVRTKGIKPLSKENALGARINTDGWSLYFNYGLIKNNEGSKTEIDRFYNTLYFQLELSEKYHPKEYRDFAYNGGNSYRNMFFSFFSKDMFKYGKINNFYSTKVGIGYKYLIAGKPEANTISIHWNTNGGLALGLLKPYFFRTTGAGEVSIDPNDTDLLNNMNRTQYIGAAGFTKGWNKLKIVPGMYLRSGLKFDYSNKRHRLAGIEVGLSMEYYFSKIDQMALQKPKSLFTNAYCAFEIGWKK